MRRAYNQSNVYAEAWKRSRAYGVDPEKLPELTPLGAQELSARIYSNRLLLESALPYVDQLYSTVESECIVAICDADGYLLATRGERLPDKLLQHHTTPGMSWHENVYGANALGTALAEDRPVHMVGDQHYNQELHGMSCAATPLHDPQGNLVGGLAIAAYKREHSPYMLGTVLSIGHAIDKAMILKSEHYRTLLLQEKIAETSNNLILVTAEDGTIIHLNEAAKSLLVQKDDAPQLLQEMFCEKSAALVALQGRKQLTDFVEEVKSSTGDIHHIFWDAHWIEDDTNATSTLLLVGRDMTKFVRLERSSKQGERLSTMGKFAAQIAHEIRNPVAVIKLAMQLMLKQEEFSEKSEKKGKMILSELRRIEDLVNHFLNISKPQTPSFGSCYIVETLRDTCNLMQTSFLQGNLHLVEHYEEIGPIIADCDQLQQVFLNLLNNAIDATPSGGTIDVRVRRDEAEPEFVQIVISDTGQGIPEDRLADVFEPFYTTKSRGTGLGLSNAKSIIEAHGGDMEVESAVDHGTIVSIWLPFEPTVS
ncbi:signal transduction histidine kinase [Tumebacillus sp. BK434]|uniref:ATP-binding protein n=1 Tax=Tumebacillus sp. BK434 TaxID=2512169 RepID=UPI00104FCD41|nr:ATP-binding protein [Tumebacillus sp. BK434]TCP55535.1 signal transduction histidine kinase [Tumebacillus sp. BK434]